MSHSITFNSIDLGSSSYGLTVVRNNLAIPLNADSIQLIDKAYAFDSYRTPKPIDLEVVVVGTSLTDLQTKLDAIRYVLNETTDKQLKFDVLSDRYWLARFISFNGNIISPVAFRGSLSFICYDPLAYSTSETEHDYSIDADPKTVTPSIEGTAVIDPVYTLTAGELLSAVTIKVENVTRDEELQIITTVASGKELVIDIPSWIVTNDGSADMDDVSGKFPRLSPGVSNSIKVTGFSTTGTLNITYRERYV